jgi:hypothetical protein
MPDETHDAESNARAAVRWAEREFATTHLIHGPDQELGGYSILVRASGDPLVTVSHLLMMTLLDEFLSNHRTSDVAALLDHWQAGNTMRRAGSSQRVVVTMQGLRVEAR